MWIDILISLAVGGVVLWIIISNIIRIKKGKNTGCGCGCAGCSGCCSAKKDKEKKDDEN